MEYNPAIVIDVRSKNRQKAKADEIGTNVCFITYSSDGNYNHGVAIGGYNGIREDNVEYNMIPLGCKRTEPKDTTTI